MIGRLDYIVNIYRLITHAYSICLIYIPCLIMTEPAALYMIGIVSEIHLYLMINATFNSIFFLFSQHSQQIPVLFSRRLTHWFLRRIRYIPRLSRQKSPRNLIMSAVISNGSFWHIPFFCSLCNWNITHENPSFYAMGFYHLHSVLYIDSICRYRQEINFFKIWSRSFLADNGISYITHI